MIRPNLVLPALAALALAACQQPADDSNIAIDNAVNAEEAAAADVETLPPSESGGAPADAAPALDEADDAGSELPSPPGTEEAGMIPDQYRGRWGINAADCDQGRSDAKGAITIGERSMTFYESRAILKERRPAIATSFSGLFAFNGEGQSWERVETLTRTGERLERRSTAPRGGAGDTLTYTRCKSKEPS